MIIVLTGPESCGKTQLAEALSRQLNLPVVHEHARNFLQPRASKPDYQPSDLIQLLELQMNSEQRPGSLILDTDILTLIIWWREKYGPVPEIFQHTMSTQLPRHYLLCAPDLAWQPDPLRENPHDRERLFAVYERELTLRGLSFDVVHGVGQSRLDSALAALKKMPANFSIG